MFSSRKSAAPAAGGYTIAKSLRFRSSASAYLSRTPASAGNQQKWTWSGWVKRGLINASFQRLFSAKDASNDDADCLRFNSGETFTFFFRTTPNLAITGNLTTTQVFRDPSAWYHIVAVLDTTDATSSNRMKLYINGSQVTAFSTATYPAQNASGYINSTNLHTIGNNAASLAQNFDGYMAEVNFIDGQALTPTSFGATNAATGVWQPIKYTGTYGTNGFYLKFTDTTSTSTLGNDSSGNNNTWTVNNISLTSGSTYDSMTDVPTNTSATVANYCVINPLWNGYGTPTFSNGNLQTVTTTTQTAVGSMTLPNASKTYFEATILGETSANSSRIGIRLVTDNTQYGGWVAVGLGTIRLDDVNQQTSLGTYTTGDVIGVAVDLSANTLQFYKNGSTYGTSNSISNSSNWVAQTQSNAGSGNTITVGWNFGQRPFAYTPPSGYVALNTFNLSTPTIGATASTQANKYMDATLYTGTGASLSVTNANSFQPDLVWIKCRSDPRDHKLTDSVRGTTKGLISNTTGAETTDTNGLTAFNSNGFTIGSDAVYNTSTNTYVAWQWRASNTTAVTNTSGSITSTVSANTTAGFSIVTWTGNGLAANIGHGLGVVPNMIITKFRSSTSNWSVYTTTTGAGSRLKLNLTDATSADGSFPTTPTSSIFYVNAGSNDNGVTMVAYCFAQVAGYSAFGSYTGNGSSDGPFVFTGFRPKYVMIKLTSAAGGDWFIFDSARNTYNVIGEELYAESSAAGATGTTIDFLSNGFKLRTSQSGKNGSSENIIYAAFAESPFKFSNAR